MTAFAAAYWFWFLLFVLVAWLVAEIGWIIYAHVTGQKNIFEWTLSDTIRRWSAKYRWLAPIVAGLCAFLLWHFFIEQNPVS